MPPSYLTPRAAAAVKARGAMAGGSAPTFSSGGSRTGSGGGEEGDTEEEEGDTDVDDDASQSSRTAL